MKVTVLVVGRIRGVLEPAVTEFETRASRYWKLEVIEVEAGVGKGGSVAEAEVRRAEAQRLRLRMPSAGEVWALTRDGRPISSHELSRTLAERTLDGVPGVTFVIGGAHGLDAGFVRDTTRDLSLSQMTLPHAMARLVLAEQLYRAGTILRNEPYHKGGT